MSPHSVEGESLGPWSFDLSDLSAKARHATRKVIPKCRDGNVHRACSVLVCPPQAIDENDSDALRGLQREKRLLKFRFERGLIVWHALWRQYDNIAAPSPVASR